MKNFAKLLMVISIISSPAFADEAEQKTYKLECEIGKVCIDQEFKNKIHEFEIAPGSLVKIEVTAVNGASVAVSTSAASASSSQIQIGQEAKPQTIAMQAVIPKDGKVIVEAVPANLIINGNKTGAETYKVKITKLDKQAPVQSVPQQNPMDDDDEQNNDESEGDYI